MRCRCLMAASAANRRDVEDDVLQRLAGMRGVRPNSCDDARCDCTTKDQHERNNNMEAETLFWDRTVCYVSVLGRQASHRGGGQCNNCHWAHNLKCVGSQGLCLDLRDLRRGRAISSKARRQVQARPAA